MLVTSGIPHFAEQVILKVRHMPLVAQVTSGIPHYKERSILKVRNISCCATGEMRALLPVLATMLKFSPADTARCQESAAKWETAAGAKHLAAIRWHATLLSRRLHVHLSPLTTTILASAHIYCAGW